MKMIKILCFTIVTFCSAVILSGYSDDKKSKSDNPIDIAKKFQKALVDKDWDAVESYCYAKTIREKMKDMPQAELDRIIDIYKNMEIKVEKVDDDFAVIVVKHKDGKTGKFYFSKINGKWLIDSSPNPMKARAKGKTAQCSSELKQNSDGPLNAAKKFQKAFVNKDWDTVQSCCYFKPIKEKMKDIPQAELDRIIVIYKNMEIKEEKIDGDFAVVMTRHINGRSEKIYFSKINGKWLIDPSRKADEANAIGKVVLCLSNIKQIGSALLLYEGKYHHYPPQGSEGMEILRKECMIEPKLFVCPASKDTSSAKDESVANHSHCSYIYLGNAKLSSSEAPNFPIVIEKPQNHSDSAAYLKIDCSVTRIKTNEKSLVKILQQEFKNGEKFNAENWKIVLEEAAKWDKQNGL